MGRRSFKNAYPKSFFESNHSEETVLSLVSANKEKTPSGGVSKKAEDKLSLVRSKADLEEILTLDEVATRLKRYSKNGEPDREYTTGLVRSGKMRGFKEGRYWRVLVSDFEVYVHSLFSVKR